MRIDEVRPRNFQVLARMFSEQDADKSLSSSSHTVMNFKCHLQRIGFSLLRRNIPDDTTIPQG